MSRGSDAIGVVSNPRSVVVSSTSRAREASSSAGGPSVSTRRDAFRQIRDRPADCPDYPFRRRRGDDISVGQRFEQTTAEGSVLIEVTGTDIYDEQGTLVDRVELVEYERG